MRRRTFAIFLAVATISGGARADFDSGQRLSGPLVSENLAVYFIHGEPSPGPVPLTLQEAMANHTVRVYETDDVNQLAIENRGAEEVFVQAGDIVKGGKQDRTLTVSLLLPPHSERIPIASFCVEPGRWSQRGHEDVHYFSSANAAMPSLAAKIAMKAPAAAEAAAQRGVAADPSRRTLADTRERQQRVWNYVASINRELAANFDTSSAAPPPLSLQSALEDNKLREAQEASVKLLRPAGETDPDIIGYVFAVNGKINSGEAYSSNALFRKMWLKLLEASVTEAIADRSSATAAAAPSIEAVTAFLGAAKSANPTVTELARLVRLETRETPQALYFETASMDGRWMHRNYLAK
jgi:hypothetical protein